MSWLQLVSHRHGASRAHMNNETNDKYTVIQNGSSQENCMVPLRLKVSINPRVAPRDTQTYHSKKLKQLLFLQNTK